MASDLEKARLMSALARGKGNWGEKYDRTEHVKNSHKKEFLNTSKFTYPQQEFLSFKRFQDLNDIIKELSKIGWILVHKKPNYTGISLNTEHKREIVDFIEKEMPYLKGAIN